MSNSNIYFIYFLTNCNNEVLYIGVTNHLQRQIEKHKNKIIKGFSEKNNLNKLVYFEETGSINTALAREKQLKNWRREKKNILVTTTNPHWKDLYKELFDMA